MQALGNKMRKRKPCNFKYRRIQFQTAEKLPGYYCNLTVNGGHECDGEENCIIHNFRGIRKKKLK